MSEQTNKPEIHVPKPIEIVNRITELQEELKYLKRLLRFSEEKWGKAEPSAS